MGKRKRIALALVFALCLGLFAGCKEAPETQETTTVPPVTQAPTTEPATEPTTEPTTAPTEPPMDAQRLLDILREEKSGCISSVQTIVIELEMNFDEYGMKMDMTLDIERASQWDYDQKRGFDRQTSHVVMYGQSESQTIEVYATETGDDQEECYIYSLEEDRWVRTSTDVVVLSDYILEDTAVLREETAEYYGVECYVLDSQLDGSAFANMVSTVGGALGMPDQEDLDLSGAKGFFTTYVDTESLRYQGCRLTAEGLETALEQVVNPAYAGTEMETTVSVSVKDFTMVTKGVDYSPVEIPMVDEQIKKTALDATVEPDRGDGSYILQESGVAVRITPPVGWELYEVAFNQLIMDFGNDISVYCNIYRDDYTLEDNVDYIAGYYEENYDVDMKISKGKQIGEYETLIFRGGGLYGYAVQIPLEEDVYLLIEVENFADQSPYAFLKAIVETVERVELSQVQ